MPSAALEPIAVGDLTVDLTRTFFAEHDDHLGDSTFDAKWNVALQSPLMMLRSFPRVFTAELREIGASRLPGRRGLVFGDLHPGNFGWLRLRHDSVYSFNDLDDSGYGSVAIDAVRYFVALRLAGYSEEQVTNVVDHYLDVVEHPNEDHHDRLPRAPDWDRLASRRLQRLTDGRRFRFSADRPEIEPASEEDRHAIASLATRGGPLSRWNVLDVAMRRRAGGGSGGLSRYLALVERNGNRSILEVREDGPRATDQEEGPHARMATLQRAFWGVQPRNNFFHVQINGRTHLVRNRFNLDGLDVYSLPADRQLDILRAQMTRAGVVHAPLWRGTPRTEAREWLLRSSDAIADRWRSAWRQATGNTGSQVPTTDTTPDLD